MLENKYGMLSARQALGTDTDRRDFRFQSQVASWRISDDSRAIYQAVITQNVQKRSLNR